MIGGRRRRGSRGVQLAGAGEHGAVDPQHRRAEDVAVDAGRHRGRRLDGGGRSLFTQVATGGRSAAGARR